MTPGSRRSAQNQIAIPAAATTLMEDQARCRIARIAPESLGAIPSVVGCLVARSRVAARSKTQALRVALAVALPTTPVAVTILTVRASQAAPGRPVSPEGGPQGSQQRVTSPQEPPESLLLQVRIEPPEHSVIPEN